MMLNQVREREIVLVEEFRRFTPDVIERLCGGLRRVLGGVSRDESGFTLVFPFHEGTHE